MSPEQALEERFRSAIAVAFGREYDDVDPLIRPSQYADFQADVALPLARRLGRPPREIAQELVAALDVDAMCRPPEISGPGFVNLVLREEWLSDAAGVLASHPRLGVPTQDRQVVVVDYSAPNVAKEMHVGHLRTTVVGDALARILGHLGHHVIRQNHVGDWGTPFGMLIEHLVDVGEDSEATRALADDPNAFYQAAREAFDGSAEFADRARRRVVALQAGDPETLRLWHELVELSKTYFHHIYDRLGVLLTDDDLAGESRYNDDLAKVCDELEAVGLATVSDGALCVFLDGFTGREGRPLPLIVRKRDGGYGYATTDLATVRHRVRDLGADRMLYVIGTPQNLHLRMVWETARLAGWLPAGVDVVHVQIGNVLGSDGKMLRTRSGSPIRLMALLDEAVERTATLLEEKRPDLDAVTRAALAPVVGIGAVKYADLSVAHDSEYTFDFDRMVALQGNTGPYLQYAAARVRSIFRRAEEPVRGARRIAVAEPAERTLAIALLGFGEVVAQVGRDLEPHRLCGQLFDLAQAFTRFYEDCPVLKAEPDVRESRLGLCALTLGVLESGLGLLGILAPEQM